MDNGLTKRQADILEFIRSHDIAPTVREIGAHFGITSPNGVMCHLKALEKKGYIRRDSHKSRSIHLLTNSDELGALRRAIREIVHPEALRIAVLSWLDDSTPRPVVEWLISVTETAKGPHDDNSD